MKIKIIIALFLILLTAFSFVGCTDLFADGGSEQNPDEGQSEGDQKTEDKVPDQESPDQESPEDEEENDDKENSNEKDEKDPEIHLPPIPV